MTRPAIIAHRGASHDAPENTLAAFHLAWEQGADAIETDLRLTADGRIVAFHDEDGRRILRDPRRIRDLTLAELQALGPHIPTLDEVFATAPCGKEFVLELKEPLVPELQRALATLSPDRITLIAFDGDVISEAKRTLPACRALWLVSRYPLGSENCLRWLAPQLRTLGVDGVDLRYSRRLGTRMVASLHNEGWTVFTYTANTSARVIACQRHGLDGITTDRPGDARRWLATISA